MSTNVSGRSSSPLLKVRFPITSTEAGVAVYTLPFGRHSCTLSEFASSAFVTRNETRSEIWTGFSLLLDALRDCVGEVAACWIGGSYLLDSESPSDIDCLFIIDHERLNAARLDSEQRGVISTIANSGVKQAWDLPVDTYILEWHPRAGVDEGTALRKEQYLQYRGYYDDFWSRIRSPNIRQASIPQRGYLEVIIDGYK